LAWIVPPEAHLRDMSNTRVTCKTCGRPLPPKTGKGGIASIAATLDEEYAYEVEHVEPLRPRDRTEIDRWIEMGQRFNGIIDSPVMLARFMDELLCRIARSGLLEDHRNQRAVNQLVVIYFMVGRITDGDLTLPAVSAG
jgi:hypothetical protein